MGDGFPATHNAASSAVLPRRDPEVVTYKA
jgi:hypothetical protein